MNPPVYLATPAPPDLDRIPVLQEEQRAWSSYNFGDQPPWTQLLGVIEELGELDEAVEKLYAVRQLGVDSAVKLGVDVVAVQRDVEDAMADTIIFLLGFSSGLGLDLRTVLLAHQPHERVEDIQLVGRLAHSFLKHAQGIRGSSAHHMQTIELQIQRLFWGLHWYAHELLGVALMDLVDRTWSVVKLRDFKKNAATGDATVPEHRHFEDT